MNCKYQLITAFVWYMYVAHTDNNVAAVKVSVRYVYLSHTCSTLSEDYMIKSNRACCMEVLPRGRTSMLGGWHRHALVPTFTAAVNHMCLEEMVAKKLVCEVFVQIKASKHSLSG